MDDYLRQLLQNYQISRDPEDAIKYAEAMLRFETLPQPLQEPLTAREMAKQMKAKGLVEGYVSYDISDFLRNDEEAGFFLDSLSRGLIGSDTLSDIEYHPVCLSAGDVLFKVSGILEDNQLEELLANEVHSCAQCESPFRINEDGVSNHYDENNSIDYDADLDHVPYSEEPL